ncbi:MAG: class I SAM-dependent methyltransferase [Sedimentisphaerales bacterium]|nr:class I SAM-dependent methyltransferase [Sedimentisphaerales bacterium]
MRRIRHAFLMTTFVVFSIGLAGATSTNSWRSTRIVDANQHQRTGENRYPYRAKSQYILKELDLKPGDVVVDIGAGDGWWSQRTAEFVGEEGIVYAAEVEDKMVDNMKKKFADVPQIKPYLCKTDSTELPENSCDLAFLSQTYHHLDKDGRVDYLDHLRDVVKPTGRLCVIEKYATIATEHGSHGTALSELIAQAEQAGWIPVRCELMTGTYHYLAIFVQRDLFGPEPSSLP